MRSADACDLKTSVLSKSEKICPHVAPRCDLGFQAKTVPWRRKTILCTFVPVEITMTCPRQQKQWSLCVPQLCVRACVCVCACVSVCACVRIFVVVFCFVCCLLLLLFLLFAFFVVVVVVVCLLMFCSSFVVVVVVWGGGGGALKLFPFWSKRIIRKRQLHGQVCSRARWHPGQSLHQVPKNFH